ncbi:MAG: hypothetical protein J7K40_13650 [candidate division Zixibacteria bacterium]|nr:hypothetical protein [candidate division Zixibacteria bacterium]
MRNLFIGGSHDREYIDADGRNLYRLPIYDEPDVTPDSPIQNKHVRIEEYRRFELLSDSPECDIYIISNLSLYDVTKRLIQSYRMDL